MVFPKRSAILRHPQMGTDHAREQVPILAMGGAHDGPIGELATFSDIAASVAQHLDLSLPRSGTPF
jgi:phosphopentomutase